MLKYRETYNIHTDKFRFLPSHEEKILTIPSKIQQMEMKPEILIPTKRKKMVARISSRARHQTIKPELQSKCKSAPTRKSLRSELVTKLKDFVQSIGLELRDESMTDSNVMGFKPCIDSEYLYECHFKCPFCQNPYLVYYKTNWIMANIRKHFKRHSDKRGAGMNFKAPQRGGISSIERRTVTHFTEPRAETSSTEVPTASSSCKSLVKLHQWHNDFQSHKSVSLLME